MGMEASFQFQFLIKNNVVEFFHNIFANYVFFEP